MRTYIKKLQDKPEHVRRRIMVVTLVLSMAVVSSVWIYGMDYRFSEKKAEQIAKEENGVSKPFALFGNSINTAYKNITASVGTVTTKIEEAPIEEVPSTEKQIDLIPIEYTN